MHSIDYTCFAYSGDGMSSSWYECGADGIADAPLIVTPLRIQSPMIQSPHGSPAYDDFALSCYVNVVVQMLSAHVEHK